MDTNQANQSLQVSESGKSNLPAIVVPAEFQATIFSQADRTVLALAEDDFENERISEYDDEALSLLAAMIVNRANARYGNNPSPQNIKDAQDFVMLDLKKFGNLRKKEITTIVDKGLDGEFETTKDDVRHFNSSRFCKWIRAYIENQRRPAYAKKIQYGYQKTQEAELAEQEEKRILEEDFGFWLNKLESGQAITRFEGRDEVYRRSEELNIFKPLTLEDKNIIAKACAEYTKFEGDRLKIFSRKVAYLYVLHVYSAKTFTLIDLIKQVHRNNRNTAGALMETAYKRLDEYEEIQKNKESESYAQHNEEIRLPEEGQKVGT